MHCIVRFVVLGMIGAMGVGLTSCSDLTGDQPLPSGTAYPEVVQNAPGARKMANAARAQFQFAFTMYIPQSGLLTDEFQANTRGTEMANGAFPDENVAVDARLLPQGSVRLGTDAVYVVLQQLRALTNQAIGALKKYDPDSSAYNQGEMYAQEGYAEVWLADLFCSGVPLSTLDFQQDYTYKPSSTQQQVYEHAIVLFDSALTLAADSAPIAGLAKIGKARAQLALGQYTEAAQTVSDIPVDFKYTQFIQTCNSTSTTVCSSPTQAFFKLASIGTVADAEGEVGLPYISQSDPRSALRMPSVGVVNGNAVWFPAKYTLGSTATFVVASGVEAQLIAAEADLKAGGSNWLTILNTLRTNGEVASTYTRQCQNGISGAGAQVGSPCPAGQIDTTWGPGTGLGLVPTAVIADVGPTCPSAAAPGVACTDTAWYRGLRPLTDPGTPEEQLRLLFQERAFWLYATGTRQGDLRRLVTQYHLDKSTVYPIGAYFGIGAYGDNIDAPVPTVGSYSESVNPLFHGCLGRD
jgi:hypothetical protein